MGYKSINNDYTAAKATETFKNDEHIIKKKPVTIFSSRICKETKVMISSTMDEVALVALGIRKKIVG